MLDNLQPDIIQVALGGFILSTAVATYATIIEPLYRLVIKEHRVSMLGWGDRSPLSICIIADPHCCEPWMPLARLRRIINIANQLKPDMHVVTGDLPASHQFITARLPMAEVAKTLAGLEAPLGRFAVLGNHDWTEDLDIISRRSNRPAIERHLNEAGIPVLSNKARLIPHGSGGVWLCGTDSMRAFGRTRGADDLPATLAQIQTDAPAILLSHEPDQFANVTKRISLTLSGHTHGGQLRIAGYAPLVPSHYGNRYVYGHITEGSKHLIVSAGLGCSLLPIRFGSPPEITLVHLT